MRIFVVAEVCVQFLRWELFNMYHLTLAFLELIPHEHTKLHSICNNLIRFQAFDGFVCAVSSAVLCPGVSGSFRARRVCRRAGTRDGRCGTAPQRDCHVGNVQDMVPCGIARDTVRNAVRCHT